MSTYDQFKYSPINKNFLDALIKGYVFCASSESLNDPFDCQVDIAKAIQRAVSKSTGHEKANLNKLLSIKGLVDSVQGLSKKTGVCSFSRSLLNPVMWSHYSDEHKGVCILYKFPTEFINDDNPILGITDMSYGDNPLTDWFVYIAAKLPDMNIHEIAMEISKMLFSVKGEKWAYEDEIRVLSKIPGELKIEKSYLTQICFGLHASEKDKDLVYEVIRDSDYKVDYCEIVRHESDFGLAAKDL